LAVYGLDGLMRARRTGPAVVETFDDSVNTDLIARAKENPAGHYERVSRHDGMPRIVAYRKLSDYPIIAGAAQGTDEALEAFLRPRSTYLAVSTVASVAIVAFFTTMTLLTVRLQRRTAQLRRQGRFLQALVDNIPLGISVRRFEGPGLGRYLVWNETNAI